MSLDISPAPSRFQLSVISLIACMVMFSLWMSAIPQLMQFAASFVVLLSTWKFIRQIVTVDPDAIVRLQYEADSWWITLADGRMRKVLQAGEQVVLPWIVSLGFTDGRQRFSCAILWDALTPTEHRKLRVFVLMNEKPAPSIELSNLWLIGPYLDDFQLSSSRLAGSRLAIAGWYQNCVSRLRGH